MRSAEGSDPFGHVPKLADDRPPQAGSDRDSPNCPASSVHQDRIANPAAASSAVTPSRRNFADTSVRISSPAANEWIEMRLRAVSAQQVRVPDIGLTASFAAGEEMRTEVSAKFRREGVAAELAAAGFAMRAWWTDEAGQFGLSLSEPA